MSNNLTGRIKQLTIFGELEFIEGYNYDVSVNKGMVKLSGKFKVVDTDYVEQLTIELTTQQYIGHLKSSYNGM